jgi:hypothetical protein
MNPISGYLKVGKGIAIALAIALVCAAIGFVCVEIYDFGFRNAETIGQKNLSDYKASIDSAAASSVSAAFADYASGVGRAQATESQFFTDQSAADAHARSLKEQIDVVAQPHVVAPRAASGQPDAVQPVRECIFSRGFVRLWNAAAGITDDRDGALQAGSDSGSAADGPGSDAAADSGVSQRDVIDWFVDFANRAHGTEDKLKAIRNLQPQPASQPAAAVSAVQ